MTKKILCVSFVVAAFAGTYVSAVSEAAELAKVNGHPITTAEVDAALSGFTEGQRQGLLRDANTRRQVLESVIDQELLAQEGAKEKLDQGAQYKAALEQFRKTFLMNRLLEKKIGPKVNESAAKKYFSMHHEQYSTNEVHAQHILVSTEAEARDVLAKARESGADFQALAEKYSRDPSAKNNRGDLGFFPRGRMVPEFTDAAFGGHDGEIVGPVKTAFGYHIIKVIEHRAGKEMGFDEVEAKVENDLKQQLIKNYVEELRKNAKVKIEEKF